MPQFMVIADDYKNTGALERRMEVRDSHLQRMRVEKLRGTFIIGGAKLEEGKMVGSMLLVELEDEAAVQQWLKDDPYVVGKVWEHIEITPFRIAGV